MCGLTGRENWKSVSVETPSRKDETCLGGRYYARAGRRGPRERPYRLSTCSTGPVDTGFR